MVYKLDVLYRDHATDGIGGGKSNNHLSGKTRRARGDSVFVGLDTYLYGIEIFSRLFFFT
jgi:hypothetical protein